jgi:hypothetical protein
VCLQADEDDVGVGDDVEVIGRRRVRLEVAAWAQHAHAPLLHGAEVLAARDQRRVGTAARERGADVGADRACAEDRVSHFERVAPTRFR